MDFGLSVRLLFILVKFEVLVLMDCWVFFRLVVVVLAPAPDVCRGLVDWACLFCTGLFRVNRSDCFGRLGAFLFLVVEFFVSVCVFGRVYRGYCDALRVLSGLLKKFPAPS